MKILHYGSETLNFPAFNLRDSRFTFGGAAEVVTVFDVVYPITLDTKYEKNTFID